MDHFDLSRRRPSCRGCAAAPHCGGRRHAGLCLFARHAGTPCAGVSRRAVGAGYAASLPLRSRPTRISPCCSVLQREGYGADVVSGGELDRALAAGMPPADIVFSGVGKTADELRHGLAQDIGQFNIEIRGRRPRAGGYRRRSEAWLRAAPCGSIPMSMRARMTRFPPARRRTSSACRSAVRARYTPACPALPGLNLRGIAIHIGSQLDTLEPLETAFGKVGALVAELRAAGQTRHPCRSGRRSGRALPQGRGAALACRIRRDGRARHSGLGRGADVRTGPRHRGQCGRAADAGDPREARRATIRS